MADVKIENSSAATKRAIRRLSLGDNVLTVGAGGAYATIADALIYMAAQTGIAQLVTTAVCDFTQWDNFAPLVSGDFGDAQVGDWVYLINDDPAIDTLQYDWHYYRLLAVNHNHPSESRSGLLMESGVLGPSKVGSTVAIYRMPRYTIKLLAGIHDTAGAVFPDGYDVTFEGCGRSTIVTGGGIAVPIYGRMAFTQFILEGSVSKPDTRVSNGAVVQDAGFGAYEWRDMWIEGETASMANSQFAQSQRVHNVKCTGMKGHKIYVFTYTSYLDIDNFNVDGVTSMELCEIFAHPRRCSTTTRKIVNRSRFTRHENHNGLIDVNSCFSMNTQQPEDGHPDYMLDFINCFIEDNELNITTDGEFIFGFHEHLGAARRSHIRFIDSEINNINSHTYAFGSKPGFSQNTTLTIEFIRSHDYEDEQIVHGFTGLNQPIMLYRDRNDFSPFDWTGFIVLPADSVAETVIVGPMTANTSFINPSNPRTKQRLKIVLEQGGSAGYTISWASASLMKVHTNPTGVGTSVGDKIAFDFYFDGTHWIQLNTPAWA